MLKKIALTAAAFAMLTMTTTAMADHGWWDDEGDDDYRDSRYDYKDTGYDDGYVYAEVVDVEPVYRYVRVRQPQRECWDQRVQDRPRRQYRETAPATVTGGLIGGVIGRQFGDGRGRDAMTIVGTLIGSAMGHDGAARRNYEANHYYDDHRVRTRTVERCTTRYTSREERRIDGYHVTYVYAGREYTTRTSRQPRDRIRVRVAVTPARSGRY
ncbi:MAG: glycine zipper 2TM domain-containing protein [Gammaproteobacteria bacterium]|nr:glycine zipper 2TM domain-containing protein [Gammaproteobacteria bacterium]MDH3768107.1 glycine zipper 2TM domain-containing protein [Gammaproteobacteria bacterium]